MSALNAFTGKELAAIRRVSGKELDWLSDKLQNEEDARCRRSLADRIETLTGAHAKVSKMLLTLAEDAK